MQIGCIVVSTMGRDKGMHFIVIDCDDNYVYLADGMIRKIERIKKKKIKHIKLTNLYSDVIADKIKNKSKISNQDIKKALKEILDNK